MKRVVLTVRKNTYKYHDGTVVTKTTRIEPDKNAVSSKSVKRNNLNKLKMSELVLVEKESVITKTYDNNETVINTKRHRHEDGEQVLIEDTTETITEGS